MIKNLNKIKTDHHVYYDEGYFNLNDYKILFKDNQINQVIFSPPCTNGKEPPKSEFMYYAQRRLLSNPIGYKISKSISKSFYNKKNELNLLWKFFSKNQDLKKIIKPDNLNLLKIINNEDNFKMWYWINPVHLNKDIIENNYNDYKNKIYGIKFHQYWHNFDLNQILSNQDFYIKFNIPIYIILGYNKPNQLEHFLKNNKFKKIVFGYGGFPMFERAWRLINKYSNCYVDVASNHIDIKIINNLIKKIDIKKIIFSSDCPYNFQNSENIFDYNKFKNRFSSVESFKRNSIFTNNL